MVGLESKTASWRGVFTLLVFLFPWLDSPANDGEPPPAPQPAFADPAPLNQARTVWRTLDQIEELADSGRVVEAMRAWQMRLDGISGDGPFAGRASLRSLRLEPDWLERTHSEQGTYARYSALRSLLEAAILSRSDEDRATYDRETRPVAARLWSQYQASGDPALLESLVERFFCGSFGPKGAIQLATVHLGRGDPGQAVEMLERAQRHPDLKPSNRRALSARLRIARERVAKLERSDGAPFDVEVATANPSWTDFRGRTDGRRPAPALPAALLGEKITDRWSVPVDARPIDVAPAGLPVGLPQESQPRGQGHSQRIVRTWRRHARPPVTPVVVTQGLVLLPGEERLVAVEAASGRVAWMGRRHVRQVDPSIRQFAGRRTRFGIVSKTPPDDEMLRFFDRVPGSTAVDGDRVYVVEGPAVGSGGSSQPPRPTTTNSTRRIRSNRLVCYELQTGKQLWSRAAGQPDARFDDVGFLGGPMPTRDHVLAPVSEGGEVWLQAMSAADGSTLWRTLLCDEPHGGCSGWSPVRVVTAGSRVYVLPGTGAVFCLAARSGTLEWAVRYDRSSILSLSAKERAASRYPLLDFVGWEEDGLVAVGRHLVLLPSDLDRIVCLDRHEGTLLWDTAMRPTGAAAANELLGTLGDRLVVGGPEVVRCHEISTGRILWEAEIDGVTGRGVVTADAVYVPADGRLVALDVRTGVKTSESSYVTPSRAPLGNLAVTRSGLVSVGATHVSAISPLAAELELLAERVRQGDVAAMLARARLFDRLDRDDEAYADVSAAARAVSRARSIALARRVLAVAGDFDLASTHPRETLELAVGEETLGSFAAGDDPAFRDRWNELVYDCVATIGRESLGDATESVLRVFSLSSDDHLLRAAETVIATTAGPGDLDVLRRTIAENNTPRTRRAAVRGLESPSVRDVEEELVELLDDANASVRLAAAVALVNRGDRRGLAGLVDRLESREVAEQRSAVALLRAAVEVRFGFDASNDDASRAAAVAKWRTWLRDASAEPFEVEKPIGRTRLLRGRTLVANAQTGQVVEYDRSGRERWRAQLRSARDVQGTEDGRRIGISYTDRSFVVYPPGDREPGTVDDAPTPMRSKTNLDGRPYSVRELPDGNLLVALWDKGAVHEYDGEGKVVWKASLQGSVADARRLENGRTLVTWYSQNAVVELDREGKIVEGTRLNDMQGPRSAERLANGNTLVAQYRKARVVEVDPRGRVVWSKEGVSGPQHAQRLPNGNTLIVHRTAVVEVRRDGSVAWELPEAGVARAHRY